MTIDPTALGVRSDPVRRSWESTDCALYALGVGAGAEDPTSELAFTTDDTVGDPQRVLPTMGVVIGRIADAGALGRIGPFDPGMLVHGEQGITMHREIPATGELEAVAEVVGLYDKGKGALVVTEARSVLVETGEPLFDTRSSVYIRGEGGWGGKRGPSGTQDVSPGVDPDHVVTYRTRSDQALRYRLSGDRNRLHSDPTFALAAGFDRPILHGLCTYGFAGRALLNMLCGGDPAQFRSMSGRFSAPVVPGEVLTVRIWTVADGVAVYRVHGDDDRVVLDAGRCTFVAGD